MKIIRLSITLNGSKEEMAMKKMMKFFAAAFVAIVAVSCLQEMENGTPDSGVKMVDVTFGVSTEDTDVEGKAHVGYNGATPVMHWTKGDQVAVIDANTGTIYPFTLCGGEDTSNGMFTGQLPEDVLASETQSWALVYPYASVEKFVSKGTRHQVEAVLPVQQDAVNGGFAEGVNMLVCGTSTLEDVKMFPIGNFFKIEIQGTGITSLTVFNNDNQLNAGLCRPNIHSTTASGSYLNPTGSNRFSNKIVLVPAAGQETIAPGVYYLVCRKKYETGLTLKFTNAEGEVAFYSSDVNPDPVATGRNNTMDLGTWDAASLNWKKEEVITIDFSSQPFTEALPTTENTAVSGTYTLESSMRQVAISTTADAENEAYIASSTRGLLFDNAGDYIEFPAIPGKKLKEVQVTTAYKSTLTANVTDASGNDMDGEFAVKLYAGNVYSHILPKAEINKKYRYKVESVSNALVRLQKITLIYAGDDMAEIAGVTASATNAYDGFSVKGELLGAGLDAAAWGIEYGTSEDALAEVATGNGGVIDHFVEAAEGTYYVRVWASADNGTTKTYSAVTSVTVKKFSGTITFDFSSAEAVQQNISYVGTTGASAPKTATDITVFVNTIDGVYDYYTYTTADGVWPMTMLCHDTNASSNTGYGFAINADVDGDEEGDGYGIRFGNGTDRYCWISVPVVNNYRLVGVSTCCTKNDGRFYVCTSTESYDKNRIGYLDEPNGTQDDVNHRFEYDLNLTEGTHAADTQIWIAATSNRVYTKFIFTYEKVN